MRSASTILRLSAACLALSAAPALAQTAVHVVDDDGGPDADFLDLQEAVDAAADGDLIFVREGDYRWFTIDGKSLVLCGEGREAVHVTGGAVIRNLPFDGLVAMRGMGLHDVAVRLVDNDGTVFFDDCNLWGANFISLMPTRGVEVYDSRSVTFSHCDMRSALLGETPHGLVAEDSDVALYACRVQGGLGWPTFSGAGTDGGAGVFQRGGTLFASGCEIVAGDGGGGSTPGSCHAAGDGGNAITALPSAAGEDAIVRVRDCELVFGAGGLGCPDGGPGLEIHVAAGSAERLPGKARDLDVPAPIQPGADTTIRFQGKRGDRVQLMSSPTLVRVWVQQLRGLWFPATRPTYVGQVPAGGELEITAVGGVYAHDGYLLNWLQAVHVSRVGGRILGAPRLVITVAD